MLVAIAGCMLRSSNGRREEMMQVIASAQWIAGIWGNKPVSSDTVIDEKVARRCRPLVRARGDKSVDISRQSIGRHDVRQKPRHRKRECECECVCVCVCVCVRVCVCVVVVVKKRVIVSIFVCECVE